MAEGCKPENTQDPKIIVAQLEPWATKRAQLDGHIRRMKNAQNDVCAAAIRIGEPVGLLKAALGTIESARGRRLLATLEAVQAELDDLDAEVTVALRPFLTARDGRARNPVSLED